jgi:hypothetical protein
MTAHFIDQIDWRRPWLSTVHPVAASILQAADWRQALNAAAVSQNLQNHHGLPIHFVPQSDLPAGVAYESFISATGGVPTRDNLHDFFNALVWLTFPQIKAQLNALQAAEIERAASTSDIGKSVSTRRGKLRDGATIFDENAALLITCDSELIGALRNHHWREVFIAKRTQFGRECGVYLFGHALMEKLVKPYKAITAHTWVVTVDPMFFKLQLEDKRAWIDANVANQLKKGLATTDFTPLPVLGVPGWWESQDEAFYSDVAVFRSKRNAST